MPVLTSQKFDPLVWPEPVSTPLIPGDVNLSVITGVRPPKIREAIYKGLIPEACYITSETGRRVYKQRVLREHFAMPVEGEIRLAGPLW